MVYVCFICVTNPFNFFLGSTVIRPPTDNLSRHDKKSPFGTYSVTLFLKIAQFLPKSKIK